MLDCLAVGLGGFAGSVCRYLLGLIPLRAGSGFPWRTLCINVAGAFVLGILGALTARDCLQPRLSLALRVGVCGGFTTFSTFACESADLISRGHTGPALLYGAVSFAAGVLAVAAGRLLVR